MSLQLSAPQPLTVTHQLAQFECGEPVLDDWLKRRALSNHLSGASRTFVVADSAGRVFGYYALAAGAVSHHDATGSVKRNMPDRGCAEIRRFLALKRDSNKIGITYAKSALSLARCTV